MRFLLFFLSFLSGTALYTAQNDTNDSIIDTRYKEDQFYAGITYNFLGSKPKGLSQSGFSLGFHLGFIKDMPINKRRNIAIGIGLGYSGNSFNQNLLINKNNNNTFTYHLLEGGQIYSKNKFTTHLVELPIEFRWRTSTPTSYNFWRIYTGFKLGYLFANTSKHLGDLGLIKHTNNNDFNTFQYGLTISAGYNTWNLYLYYALHPIFSKSVRLNNGKPLDINAVKIGLMFYIL